MIERFKTRIVANGQPQILGFDCYDVHAPTIPMAEIKSSYFLLFVRTGTWNFFKWIPPQHSFLLLSSLVKSFTAIHPQMWILVLAPMVFVVLKITSSLGRHTSCSYALDAGQQYSHSEFWICSYWFWGCILDV
jgi:hypothetical protein